MSKRLTNNEFIERIKSVHGDKYDYSKVDYKNSETKVCVICKRHGDFWSYPSTLLAGGGCAKCAYEKKAQDRSKSNEEFIEQSDIIHNHKYNYSKTKYINAKSKICIICPEHGEFWQKASLHLNGEGCPECAKSIRNKSKKTKKTTDEFINECINIYGDKYDYSKVNYINAHTKICLINKSDKSEIFVTPTQLLTRGIPERKWKTGIDDFIKKARIVHGCKYDYSKSKYVDGKTKLCIICPEHGEFWQTPDNHLKFGCKKCGFIAGASKKKSSQEEFVQKSVVKHGNRYDYSKVVYKNNNSKVCIICPEHGEFWQTPSKHLNGQGCPICKNSWLERNILLELEKRKINYIFQYSPDFLKNGKGRQKLDYFLPDYNVAIECQGIQHFIQTSICSKTQVKKNKERDIRKKNKCDENNIKIIYYIPTENMQYINECEIYDTDNSFDDIDKMFKIITEK